MDVSAHGEVDEDEDVELDEDGEAEEDGVEDKAGQAEPPIQGPLVEMDAENLRVGRRRRLMCVHEWGRGASRGTCG